MGVTNKFYAVLKVQNVTPRLTRVVWHKPSPRYTNTKTEITSKTR